MGRYTVGTSAPTLWAQGLDAPPCFTDRLDWWAWADAAREAATGGEMARLRKGCAPNPCPDCDPASRHRRNAVMAGRCIPIVEEARDAA